MSKSTKKHRKLYSFSFSTLKYCSPYFCIALFSGRTCVRTETWSWFLSASPASAPTPAWSRCGNRTAATPTTGASDTSEGMQRRWYSQRNHISKSREEFLCEEMDPDQGTWNVLRRNCSPSAPISWRRLIAARATRAFVLTSGRIVSQNWSLPIVKLCLRGTSSFFAERITTRQWTTYWIEGTKRTIVAATDGSSSTESLAVCTVSTSLQYPPSKEYCQKSPCLYTCWNLTSSELQVFAAFIECRFFGNNIYLPHQPKECVMWPLQIFHVSQRDACNSFLLGCPRNKPHRTDLVRSKILREGANINDCCGTKGEVHYIPFKRKFIITSLWQLWRYECHCLSSRPSSVFSHNLVGKVRTGCFCSFRSLTLLKNTRKVDTRVNTNSLYPSLADLCMWVARNKCERLSG